MSKQPKIYVAGHRGMVGSAIVRALQSMDCRASLAMTGEPIIVTRTHAELDLTSQAAVQAFVESEKPEQVYLAAAKVGGIHANNTYPAEFICQNLMMEANVIHAAWCVATMACGVLGWAITGQSITAADVPGLDWLLGFTVVSVAFTAFAVGEVANAINIIGGFNGLAAGTVIIILSSFALMANALGDADLLRTSLIVAGAVLGFGLVNWPRGKIFLGDGGAYFVGFALAWLAVLMLARHHEVSAWAPLLVCG